jgi:hypothetical protein
MNSHVFEWMFEVAYVGQASRLTSEIKRLQARRPRYITEAKINRLFASPPGVVDRGEQPYSATFRNHFWGKPVMLFKTLSV